MTLKRGIGFLLTVLVVGCAHRSPQQKLVEFINNPENKIVQSMQISGVKVTSKWLPYQYRQSSIANGQLAKGAQPDNSLPHDDYTYFNVRFEKKFTEKPATEKVMYLDFDMQNDFTLLCSGDSLAPVICQKIENGVAGSYEYMLAFDNNNKCSDKNDFTLFYKDKIFGLGVIAFVYSQKDIRKIPVF